MEVEVEEDALLGVLLGTAIGDAIGLPFEGLSRKRVAARLARAPLRHSLVCGRGMVSDDTEHTAMVAHAWLGAGGNVDAFARGFARQLRRWVLALPPGVGLATLRGALRSCLGFSPAHSGVRSAGNGPAMRAALLGLVARDDRQLEALVRASTRITHTDPRAEAGALLVARWAREAKATPERIAAITIALGSADELTDDRVDALRERVLEAIAAAVEGRELPGVGDAGVTGFIVETMPAVAYCWLRHRDDPRAAIEAAIRLGGDTDTVAAIVGALVGAEHGAAGLPEEWIADIRDWPLGVGHLRALAAALAHDTAPPPVPSLPYLGMLARNLGMLAIVLGHLSLRVLGR